MNTPRAVLASLLALLLAQPPAASAATWDEETPRDPFIDRTGKESARALSGGELGGVLPSWHRSPLFLAWRALALDPAALAAANTRVAEAERRREEADPRRDAVKAWAAERGLTLDPGSDWTEGGVWRGFAPDVLGGYVNCAPDAFRQALATLAGLRQRKGVTPADVGAWLEAQDAVFAFCAYVPGAPAAVASPAPPPAFPAPLPARAPAHLRQLREYQLAAARFYAGDHPGALAAFDAIAKVQGHPMRGLAAIGALRAVVRQASLDLGLKRTWAEATAAGADRAAAKAKLEAAFARRDQLNEAAVREVQARAARILAAKALGPVHEVARTTLDGALRLLTPRAWWSVAADRLARVEDHPYGDDTLFQWSQLASDLVEGSPEPELGEARKRHAFVDWIATIQACADNPASPHARGGCAEAHAHALEVWTAKPGTAWLVAALVTARRLEPAGEPVLRAALEVPEASPAWQTARVHAVRLLASAGRREEALKLLLEVQPKVSGNAWQLLQQQRLSLATTLAEAAPALLRASGRVALGADGDRLLNRVLSSEELLELAELPGAKGLALDLTTAAMFRAELAGKPEVALAAARKGKDRYPKLAKLLDLYLTAPQARRREAMTLIAAALPISPTVGWRRDKRRTAWFCSFEPERAAPQLAIERTPQAPDLGSVAGQLEQASLRALGLGSTFTATQVIAVLPGLPLDQDWAQEVAAGARKALDAGGCASPDAARLRAELDRLLGNGKK